MGTTQQCSLKWTDYHTSLSSSFSLLRNDSDFIDVTFACDGQGFNAHKIVISACSVYLKKLLKSNPCQHPIVILKDIKASTMSSLMHFMYHGVVEISQEHLNEFLRAAEMLEIKGLYESPSTISSHENRSASNTHNLNPFVGSSHIMNRAKSFGTDKYHKVSENCRSPESGLKRSWVDSGHNSTTENEFDECDSRQYDMGSRMKYKKQINQNINILPVEKVIGADSVNPNSSDATEMCKFPSLSEKSEQSILTNLKQEPIDYYPIPSFNDGVRRVKEENEMNFSDAHDHVGSNSNSSDNYVASPSTLAESSTLLTNNGDNPNQCSYCGKMLKSRHNVAQHIKNMHQYKPIEEWEHCTLCDQQFKTKGRLSSHMIKKHGLYRRKVQWCS